MCKSQLYSYVNHFIAAHFCHIKQVTKTQGLDPDNIFLSQISDVSKKSSAPIY